MSELETKVTIETPETTTESTAPAAEVTEDVKELYRPKPSDGTVEQTDPINYERPDDWKEDDLTNVMLTLPFDSSENLDEAVENFPNIDTNFKNISRWIDLVKSGNIVEACYMDGSGLAKQPVRQGAKWRQKVESNVGNLAIGRGRIQASNQGEIISGQRALLRIRGALGLGGQINVPCWHSGFWINLNAPSEADVLELEHRIMREKINIGRSTNGAAFSNISVFFTEALMDFAIKQIYDMSIKERDDILDKLVVNDIQAVAWGLACAIWPNGFNYARAVMGKTAEDLDVVKEKLNLSKLLWVDTSVLTPTQISHMSKRMGSSVTAADVDRYRKEFIVGGDKLVELEGEIKVTFTQPSTRQHIDSGNSWINNIVKMTDKAFNFNDDNNARNEYLNSQSKATYLMQFAHWVKEIHVGDDVIQDRESLDRTLQELSAIDGVSEKFVTEVNKFIADSTIALVAVPTVTEDEENVYPRFPHLLPIDPLTSFFTLVVRKVALINGRV